MGQAYGFVIAAIYPVITSIFCVLIYLGRENIFIKCRNPLLLIVQNIGGMMCVFLLSLFIAMRPNYNCIFFFIGYTFVYSVFGVSAILRIWQICVNFHISLLKLQYRSSLFLNWNTSSWFSRHKWVGEPPFLRKVLLASVVLFSIPIVFIALPGQTYFEYSSLSCNWKKIPSNIMLGVAILFWSSSILMGTLYKNAKDAYKIKVELGLIALVWFVAVTSFVIYTNPVRRVDRYFSASNIIILANFFSLLICNVIPLHCAWEFEKACRGEQVNSLAIFKKLLLQLEFRDRFHDFLNKTFCQENLQFYEVVTLWKNLSYIDPTRYEKLRSIIEVFVIENSVCEVSLEDKIRTKIMQDFARADPPNTIFDEAVEALIQDMHANSYRQYRVLNKGTFFTTDYQNIL